MSLGPEGSFYDTWVFGPTVLYHADTFHMWFAGWDGTSSITLRYVRIGYATSPDGIEWTVQNNDNAVVDVGYPGAWDSDLVRYSSVLIHENRFKMWFDGIGIGINWKIGYALGDTVINNVGITEQRSDLISALYPNPCSGAVRLRYQISDIGYLTLDLYSISGLKIGRLMNEKRMPGTYDMEVDLSDLPAGVYFFRLTTDEGMEMAKVVKL